MAASSLGRLTLDLLVQTADFTGPLSRAERQSRDSSRNIASNFDIATFAVKVLHTAVAGLSVAGMAAFASQTIDTGNEIKKFAQLSNTSIRDFQYYAKGAETAGISMESFADKMKDMQDRIGDFQQSGGGPLADFFENIAPLVGVTIQQFQKLSGPQAMQLYYDSLQKVNATQNDMKFYMEAIISDSSLLIPLLENGGEGFRKWGEAAEKANAILSDEMIENLALAKENLQLMDLQWQGLEARLINNVVPVVQAVANNMDDIKAVAIAVAAAIGTKLVVQGTILAGTFTMAAIRGAAMELSLIGLQRQALGAASSMTILRGVMGFLGGPAGLAMLAAQGVAAGAAFYYMKRSSDDLDPSLTTQGKSIAELRVEYEKLDATQQRVLVRKATDQLEDANQLYREQRNELLGLVDAITRVSDVSDADKTIASQLFEQYRKNQLTADQLATAINNLSTVSDSAKSSIDKKSESVSKEAGAVKNAQSILDVYTGKVSLNTKANQDNARSIIEQEKAILSLNQKQREALKSIQSDMNRESYIQASMKTGLTRDHAEYYADYKDKAGLPFNTPLSTVEVKLLEQGYKLKEQTKDREESEKRIEEVQKRQLEMQKKQNVIAASANETTRNMLKTYQALMNTGVFSDQQARYFTAEIGRENDFKSGALFGGHTDHNNGAKNLGMISWQKDRATKLASYLKSKGLIDDAGNIKQTQEALDAQANFLAQEILTNRSYAKSKNALMNNAGYGDLQRIVGKNYIGWDYAGKKINAQTHHDKRDKYYAQLNKILGDDAGSGISSTILSVSKLDDEIANVAQRLKDEKKSLIEYYDEFAQLTNENEKQIRDINEKFADDPSMRNRLLRLQAEAYQQDVENYIKAQDEKAEAQRRVARDILEAQYAVMNNSRMLEQQIKGLSGSADDIFAQASMTPNDYAKWALQNEKSNAQLALGNQRVEVEQSIMTSDNYQTDDERYQALLEAHKTYRDGMYALDVQYALQSKELTKAQEVEQLELWSGILSTAQNTFAQLTQSVKDGAGEQSGIYKTMFAFQQIFSIASSTAAAFTAYTQAFADPSAMTLQQKFAGGAAVMAALTPAIASISSLSLQGMAHDGIDNIPSEGTWLLDGGERVLNPQQNKDLTRYLESGNRNNGQPVVNVTTLPGTTATASRNSDGSLDIRMQEIAEQVFTGQLRDPNSSVSKSMSQNINAGRKRT